MLTLSFGPNFGKPAAQWETRDLTSTQTAAVRRPNPDQTPKRVADASTDTELALLRAITELGDRLTQQTDKLNSLRTVVSSLVDRRAQIGSTKSFGGAALHSRTPDIPRRAPIRSATTITNLLPTKPRTVSNATESTVPKAWKQRDPPLNPLHRNSPRRLIIDHIVPRNL